MARIDDTGDGEHVAQMLTRVQLPLENLEFTIDSYLQDNGSFLDKHTRAMLITVRENVHRVALSARILSLPAAGRAGVDGPMPHGRLIDVLPIGS